MLTEGRTLARLSTDRRERVLHRAACWPLFRDLLEIAKIIACFAYFDDPGVDAHIRRTGE